MKALAVIASPAVCAPEQRWKVNRSIRLSIGYEADLNLSPAFDRQMV
jgi:hypothetical protein